MSLLKAVKQRLNQIPDNVNIEQLDLSEIKILRFDEETKKYLEKCKKIKYLVMQKCGLQSLENLPKWKLTAIDVSENNLKDNSIAALLNYPTLTQVVANDNAFENVDNLKPLVSLKQLTEVDFSQNPVSAISTYRQTMFTSVPQLQVVDHKDRDGNIVDDEEEEVLDDSDDDQDFDHADNDVSEDYEEEQEEQEESEKPKRGRK